MHWEPLLPHDIPFKPPPPPLISLIAARPDDESEVETLLQRVAEGLMPEFRREAVHELKDLLVDNPKAQV